MNGTIFVKQLFCFLFHLDRRILKTEMNRSSLFGEHAMNRSATMSRAYNAADLKTLIRLFGFPPLQSNEKLEHFEEMMNKLTECMRSEDFVVSVFVYQVGIETWCTMRWKRYQALMINRWERTAREFEAQRAKLSKQRNAAQKDPPELIKGAEDEISRIDELTPSIQRTFEDCMTAVESAKEIDLVVAFERGIDKLQSVELLIGNSQKRCNDAFRQIEWYRTCLAQDLRLAADAIIEGECKQIETTVDAAPLVPGKE
jgi:hypothetical protein